MDNLAQHPISLWLTQHPEWVLVSIGLLAALESLAVVGLLVPGVLLLAAASFVAGQMEISWLMTLGAAMTGAFLGDLCGFLLGTRGRTWVLRWKIWQKHPDWLPKSEKFFVHYGIASVFLGRFIGPLRPLIPLIAGLLHMPSRHFMAVNLVSSVIWAPLYLAPGYWIGQGWTNEASTGITVMIPLVLSGILLLLLLAFVFWGRLHLHPQYPGPWQARIQAVHLKIPWLHPFHQATHSPLATWVLALFSLLSFIIWTLLYQQQVFAAWDAQVLALMQTWQTSTGQTLMQMVSFWGDLTGVLVLSLPWVIYLVWRKAWWWVVHWCVVLASTSAITTLLKHSFARLRPHTPEHLSHSFAYPSAHSSISVALFGLILTSIAVQKSPPHRSLWYVLASLPVLATLISRLYLQVHWFSDVIAGALIGLACVALGRAGLHTYAPQALVVDKLPAGRLLALTWIIMLVLGMRVFLPV
ncbi:undecaprenyl-diphosphatase [Allopseudospirillum japonicum]|uniref:Undecaprenyl-diphosphatase n=1 Tax=Allopseudospirillum japonicum TaxID=64971 RepID=A0A1H6SJR9_9GAMM|nr:bifunctional DedA family/phosphatase PAP2 family protein [Allopseudospirillum japonicum]SEI68208.1 undecaprenyl-diphosphatase [Allopseudospirillum japonicum]